MKRTVTAAAALSLVPLLALTAPVQADGPPTVTTIAEGFEGPLDLAIGSDRTLYVTEFGSLTSIDRRGERTVLATGQFAGVDARGRGTLTVTSSTPPESEEQQGDTFVSSVGRDGSVTPIADLWAYEVAHNPDADQVYGFDGGSAADCLAAADAFGFGPHGGVLESNPFGLALDGSSRIVADAAGNSVLKVRRNGDVSTLAVLPPIPVEFTDELRLGLIEQFNADAPPEEQLPPDTLAGCVGATFYAEPVPTDVEVGPHGDYYVSSLPGFPEAPGSGSVFRVDRRTGAVDLVATGFSGAVDLAVARDGTIYVAELFGGQVSKVVDGDTVATLPLDSPSAVEVARDGTVYVAVGAFGPAASVVTVRF